MTTLRNHGPVPKRTVRPQCIHQPPRAALAPPALSSRTALACSSATRRRMWMECLGRCRSVREPRRHAIWPTSVVLNLGLESARTSKTNFQESLGGSLGLYPDHALGHFTPDERREYESQWQRREQETKANPPNEQCRRIRRHCSLKVELIGLEQTTSLVLRTNRIDPHACRYPLTH
jgi:hypothetical protein